VSPATPKWLAKRIVDEYQSGASQAEVARRLGVGPARVAQVLRDVGVEPHPPYTLHARQYPIDHNAFEHLDEETAYWVGFLMADGCIVGNNCVQLSSHVRDLDHLRRFVAFAGSPKRPIGVRGRLAVASLYSPKLVEDLARFGVRPRKSYGATASESVVKMPAFWLGVIDGDGTVGLSRAPYISVCGSKPLMKQYQAFLAGSVLEGRTQRLFVRKPDRLCFVRVEGDSARRLAEVLYSASPVCLPRKADKAGAVLRYRSWYSDDSFSKSTSPELLQEKRLVWQGQATPRSAHIAAFRGLIEREVLPRLGYRDAVAWKPTRRSSMVAYEASLDEHQRVLIWATARPRASLPESVLARRVEMPVHVLHFCPADPELSWAQQVGHTTNSLVPMKVLRAMSNRAAA
jgi:hypothetical protein